MFMNKLTYGRLAALLALGLAVAQPVLATPRESSVCDEATLGRVLDDAGVQNDGHVRASACRPLGGLHGLLAVAVARGPAEYDWTNGKLPVYVAWYDPSAERVVARARADIAEDAATQVNANSLRWERTKGLAPDAAALVVNDFVLSGAMEGDNGPTWTLFVADGPLLHAVLGPAMLSFARSSVACREGVPATATPRS